MYFEFLKVKRNVTDFMKLSPSSRFSTDCLNHYSCLISCLYIFSFNLYSIYCFSNPLIKVLILFLISVAQGIMPATFTESSQQRVVVNGNSTYTANDEIVISGISGRLPESNSIAEFKENLFAGVDLVTDDDRRWPSGKTI